MNFPAFRREAAELVLGINDGKDSNVWTYDLSRTSPLRQLTFGGRNRFPIWSADGKSVTFQSDRDGDRGIYLQRADGTGPAVRLTNAVKDTSHVSDSWSADGERLLFDVEAPTGFSLWMFSARDKKAGPVGDITSASIPPSAVFSPDGRWIAFQGGEVPDTQIYLQSFPAMNAKYKVANGRHPRWSSDGKQLTYGVADRLYAVDVNTGAGFSVGNAAYVAQGLLSGPARTNYDISADAGRFIGVVDAPGQATPETPTVRYIEVVLNWFEELRQRVPTK
jgi:Tol biopolymer transport system component